MPGRSKKKLNELSITTSLPLLKSDFSLLLTRKNIDAAVFEQHMKTISPLPPPDGIYITMLVRVFPNKDDVKNTFQLKGTLIETLEKLYSENRVDSIWAFKDNYNIILHLYVDSQDRYLLTTEKLQNICTRIVSPLEENHRYFMSIGKKVSGILNVHESYDTAVIAIKKTFFTGYNSIVFYSESRDSSFIFDEQLFMEFRNTIEKQNKENSIFFIKRISFDLKRHTGTLIRSIKDFYFRLVLALNKAAEKLQFALIDDLSGESSLLEYFPKINTMDELEELLVNLVQKFYNHLEIRNSSNRMIDVVIGYIQEHYHEENLSITRVSDYVHLAPTYLCTLFKDKTGRTLNQYITEVRIEKSKDLLMHKNYKISDIASMVGLGSQGYFTKLFRKATGSTPSKYMINK